MRLFRSIMLACAALVLSALSIARQAEAQVIPYPASGTVNPVIVNTFTALTTGSVTATIAAPTGAGLSNEFGYSINGGATVFTGLLNFDTVGTSFTFGVTAGDILRLFSRTSDGDIWSSDVSLNSDGLNHIYTVGYTGTPDLGPLVPLGRYVSFEDLPGGGDLNYNDLNLVLTNITAGVPEPSTWAMMLIGFVGLGYMSARRRRLAPAAA
jgi:hypothetical protein